MVLAQILERNERLQPGPIFQEADHIFQRKFSGTGEPKFPGPKFP